ncbi:MAG: helix-turn-helix domain-containing protein [Actinomycetota bacterium]|nr:helix-turn-helix domain-containing protein [Actinomycetota bacterium]
MAARTHDAGSPTVRRSAAQTRIIDAAFELFAEHGVGGTSLQMIADEIGVTKAAVYHQFKTKESIILAAVEEPLAKLEAAADAAETESPASGAVEVFLSHLIDLVVDHRAQLRSLSTDPAIGRLVDGHERFQRLRERERRLLTSGDDSPTARVRAAMVSSALTGAASHALVADIDDDTLRAELLRLGCAFLGVTPSDDAPPS